MKSNLLNIALKKIGKSIDQINGKEDGYFGSEYIEIKKSEEKIRVKLINKNIKITENIREDGIKGQIVIYKIYPDTMLDSFVGKKINEILKFGNGLLYVGKDAICTEISSINIPKISGFKNSPTYKMGTVFKYQ